MPLPPLPLLTKEGSEKPQKLPTRFGEEPKKNSRTYPLIGLTSAELEFRVGLGCLEEFVDAGTGDRGGTRVGKPRWARS